MNHACVPPARDRVRLRYGFKVEGDLLTLCYTTADSATPNDLKPGEGRKVVVYRRQRFDSR
jgi:hypothetical protein